MTNEQMATAELLATGGAFVTTLDDIKKLISTRDEHIAQLEAERDALAAALEPFVRFAKQVSSSPNWVPDGCPVNVDPGGISDLAVGAFRRAEQALADPAALLAARDARMKREGKMEALRGLPPKHERLFGSLEYIRGWNGYREKVDAALDALEKEGRNDG